MVDVRKAAAAAFIAGTAFVPALAQETTPSMVAAAEKEGKVVWYTAVAVTLSVRSTCLTVTGTSPRLTTSTDFGSAPDTATRAM